MVVQRSFNYGTLIFPFVHNVTHIQLVGYLKAMRYRFYYMKFVPQLSVQFNPFCGMLFEISLKKIYLYQLRKLLRNVIFVVVWCIFFDSFLIPQINYLCYAVIIKGAASEDQSKNNKVLFFYFMEIILVLSIFL